MAFGAWYRGYFDGSRPIPALMIVPSKNKLPNGDTGYELSKDDLKQLDNIETALCIRFWNRCKKHGHKPWTEMTPQQLSVIELFDALSAKLEKEPH